MGVKSFYKWLVQKYPKIVVQAKQDSNGLQFDNLYIDMNEIIHCCFHGPSPPVTFDDVFINISDHIDHIFSIVRPRNLLYLSIDGVPPRGKMNQQRTRRFRTASDTELAEAEELVLRKEFEMQGKPVLAEQKHEVSDSNAIAPGTEFMFSLSEKLQHYITSRISNHPDWKDIMVILSDANVPGEGEHKIFSFIRQQRTLPDYNPNTRHCLYGLDSDLIMFALATHEIHLSILRQDVLSVRDRQSICMSDLQISLDLLGSSTLTTEEEVLQDYGTVTNNNSLLTSKSYQFLHIWIFREYLEIDMRLSDPPENFTADIERLIDDFIFMCFFIGNDFLPAIPSLQIYEDAIDLLVTIYKTEFKNLGGYLVNMERVDDKNNGFVNLDHVERFFRLIGTYEEMVCRKRSELFYLKCITLSRKSNALEEKERCSSSLDKRESTPRDLILQNTKELKAKLKARLQQKYELFRNGRVESDAVKPETADWRERYYKEKFSLQNSRDVNRITKEIVHKYTEGLLWLLIYYFSDIPSWSWYYPYHYAPFASDMKGLGDCNIKFQKGSPFKPFDQLLAVLPPSSSQLLPKAYRKLMTDEKSNIIHFYPTELEIDTDGKLYKWQGICKLPFIDEDMLINETGKLEDELGKHEAQRNMENVNKIFMRRSNMPGLQLVPLVVNLTSGRKKHMLNMENGLSGLRGLMRLLVVVEGSQDLDLTFENLWNYIMEKDVLVLAFEFQKGSCHIPRPLPGVEFPCKSISEDDIKNTQLWHEIPIRQHRRRYQVQKSSKNVHYTKASASNEEEYKSHFAKSRMGIAIHKGAGIGWAGRGAGAGLTSRLPIGATNLDIYVNSNKAKAVPDGLKWQWGGFQPSKNDSNTNNQRQSTNNATTKEKDL